MKADLTIYSHAVDVGGQCMCESLILGHNLVFRSCDIMVGFCKSVHILDSLCHKVVNTTSTPIGVEGYGAPESGRTF